MAASDAFTRFKLQISDGLNQWLRDSGEQWVNKAGTVFMWGAALHAVYVMAVPEPLRPAVAQRNAGRAMRASVVALAAAGAYDLLQSMRVERETARLNSEYRRLIGAAAGPAGAEHDDEGASPASGTAAGTT